MYLPKVNRTVEMPPSSVDANVNSVASSPLMARCQSRLTDDYAIATTFAGDRDGAPLNQLDRLSSFRDSRPVWVGRMTISK